MKLLQIQINGKTFFTNPPTKILEQSDFRIVPGRLVKGMHLGIPLVDLGMMVSGQEIVNPKGFVCGNQGFFADEIVSEADVDEEKITIFPEPVWNQRKSYTKGIIEQKGKRFILINDSLNKHWIEEIEAELKARKWL